MRLSWRRHAVLFVIPGASGGFAPINAELYRDNRAFRDSIDCTGAVIENMLGWSAAAAFRGETAEPMPTQFERRRELVHHGMTRIALIDQWRAAGVTAGGAVGVSMGEVIAPYAAGAISREECARLVAVVSQAVSRRPPCPHRVYVVALNAEAARRLCGNAPAHVDFLGATGPEFSLVICRDDVSEAVRGHFGDAIVKDAPSGYRYHTPLMDFDREWVSGHLNGGVALRPAERPIYSSAVGGQLPGGTRLDARSLHWIMGSPSHFAHAVSAALADGFDAVVQIAAKPLYIFADVAKTAEARGRRVRQFQSIDPKALAAVRRMRRRAVTPRGALPPAMPDLDGAWWRDVAGKPRDPATERISERLLQPLVEGQPFDVVSALADPLADATGADRHELTRLLTSSVLALLQDDGLRQRAVHANGDEGAPTPRTAAIAAFRALLRLAPGFAVFQPLNTVHRVNGQILQLVISR